MTANDRVLSLLEDPALAHSLFFGVSVDGRSRNKDAPFHAEMIRDWHSSIPNVLTMAFRGSAKSTKAEEAITLEICFRRVKNVLILGESETRASERLAAIKHHFEYNQDLQQTFDIGPGDPWTETRACTSTGVMIQAYGRGQSLRGVKHLDERPDFIFLDDVEDKESGSVATPEARKKTRSWLAGTVIPTLAPGGRMRMAATPLHPEALAPTLAKADRSWTTRTYPILYRYGGGSDRPGPGGGRSAASPPSEAPGDDDPSPPLTSDNPAPGDWVSAWPDRFTLPAILRAKLAFEELGEGETYRQEFMCEAVDPSSQVFTDDMIVVAGQTLDASGKIVPAVARSWHPVYAIYDPARTTNKASATTGKVVASWQGNRLIVWEASAQKWMPDEIVADIFLTNARYSPVAVGVEENGLNEWLLQPIRTRALADGVVIPLRPLRAPRGKLDFIKGLQPYFASRSVIFADHLPDLRQQLLGFPTGHIDAPNALAYMLMMKLGVPLYDNFTDANISEGEEFKSSAGAYLLLNSNNQITTGIFAQHQAGRLVVLADWVLDGDPGTVLTDLVRSALLARSPGRDPPVPTGTARRREADSRASEPRESPSLRLLGSPKHFDEYTTYGLRAAVRRAGYELERGASPAEGREEIRALLRRVSHGRPALAVAPDAAWTLRAFSGGYAREPASALPIDNAYSLLIEPLEAFAGRLRLGAVDPLADRPRYEYTADGRRYISALAKASS